MESTALVPEKDSIADDPTSAVAESTSNIVIEKEEKKEVKSNENRISKQENAKITVAVTGASGFIAAHCVKQLLEKGYNVRGTVRGDPSSDKYKWLYELSERFNLPSKITLFKADLLSDGTFTECFKDCDYIFHTASPFFLSTKDPMKDLIEPAKNGTLNVLNCAMEANKDNKTLKRMIITSSIAAVTGDSDPKKLYTEKDWNTTSDLETSPYSMSKAEAERAAWDWMEANKSKISFDMVTVNPALVIGRHLNNGLESLNTSNAAIARFNTGGVPVKLNVFFTIVDVRDVAAAHLLMIERKEAKGRYLCCKEFMSMSEIMKVSERYCSKHNIPIQQPGASLACSCCWCLVMCIACCQSESDKQYLRKSVNKGAHYSTEKIEKLGFEFRDNESTFAYTLDYLHEAGFIGQK